MTAQKFDSIWKDVESGGERLCCSFLFSSLRNFFILSVKAFSKLVKNVLLYHHPLKTRLDAILNFLSSVVFAEKNSGTEFAHFNFFFISFKLGQSRRPKTVLGWMLQLTSHRQNPISTSRLAWRWWPYRDEAPNKKRDREENEAANTKFRNVRENISFCALSSESILIKINF